MSKSQKKNSVQDRPALYKLLLRELHLNKYMKPVENGFKWLDRMLMIIQK